MKVLTSTIDRPEKQNKVKPEKGQQQGKGGGGKPAQSASSPEEIRAVRLQKV